MRYDHLSRELSALLGNDNPRQWYAFQAIHNDRIGLNMWPASKNRPPPFHNIRCERLRDQKLLFNFHVTQAGTARILLRAAWQQNPPGGVLEENWIRWRDLAIKLGAQEVQENGNPITSKSVAKWSGGPLTEIASNTPPSEAAKAINNFLKGNSPKAQALRALVAHEDFP